MSYLFKFIDYRLDTSIYIYILIYSDLFTLDYVPFSFMDTYLMEFFLPKVS